MNIGNMLECVGVFFTPSCQLIVQHDYTMSCVSWSCSSHVMTQNPYRIHH